MKFLEKLIIWLPGYKEYVQQMKKTEQDPIFHKEGNVWNHVEMVLDEIEKLNIKEKDKNILRFCGAFHDIGKPYCSKEIDGHISSHGHSKIGYHIAKKLLLNSHLSSGDKLEVINLIRQHGEAIWVLDKEFPDREAIKLSMICRLDLLYLFSRCDVLGRICEDKEELLEKLEYFKTISTDLKCFYKKYNFTTPISKFNYLVKKTHHHTDLPYNDTKSKVYMVCGLPGSGKDYYIGRALSWLPVISLDDIRKELKIKPTDEQGLVIQTAKERAREYMRKGEDFVWNATNITKQLRSGLISLFVDYNSYISITFMNTDLTRILKQNASREQMIPENVILKLYNKMEIPTDIESHELNIIS